MVTGGIHEFKASGGSPPYTFSLTENSSGGRIDSATGLFTAGEINGSTDTVRVTDAVGTIADASITVNAVLHLGTRSANVFSGNSLDLMRVVGCLPIPLA